jgi:indole-3-glycerol phosphate synthase
MSILLELAESRKEDIPIIQEIVKRNEECLKAANFEKQKRKPLSQILKDRQTLGIIAEIKPASPSQGRLLSIKNFQTDISTASPEERLLAPTIKNIKNITQSMISGGAIAFSVLVEPRKFEGSYGNLNSVAQITSPSIPILLKDFNISRAQLELGKHCGASNALLITSICNPIEMFDLMHEVGLEPLIEIHDEGD